MWAHSHSHSQTKPILVVHDAQTGADQATVYSDAAHACFLFSIFSRVRLAD